MTAAPRIIRSAAEARRLLGPEAAQRAARHALWRRGDLTYLLHKGRDPDDPVVRRYVPERIRARTRRGQIDAHRAIARARAEGADTFVVKTGRQYGKSLYFVVESATMCVRSIIDKTEPTRIPYAAPSGKQVDEFITPHFRLLQQHAPPELRPEYESKSGSWVFPNGSRIVVAGCEDQAKAERLRGPRAHMAIVDEAGFIPIVDYVIESVLGWQLATTGGLMLVSSTPPVSLDHPFVALWETAKALGWAFESTTPEAPHMTPELIDKAIRRCGGEHTVAWKREGLGELISDPDKTVLPEFSEHHDLVVREWPRPEYFLPHVIGDGGFEDLSVYAFGYYDFKEDIDVIEDEVVMRRARSDQIDAKIAAKERELWGDMKVHRRRVDAPAQVRADMSREEWQSQADSDEERDARHWQPVTKPTAKRIGSMQSGANHARVRIQDGRVAVHPRCKTIIAHAQSARWNRQRDSFERVKDSQGDPLHHYDGAATLIYFIRDLDHRNPYPAIPPGVTADDHFIPPALLAKQRGKQLFGKRR